MSAAVTAGRRLAVAAAVLVTVGAAIAVWMWTLPSSTDGLSMGEYGSEKQWEWRNGWWRG